MHHDLRPLVHVRVVLLQESLLVVLLELLLELQELLSVRQLAWLGSVSPATCAEMLAVVRGTGGGCWLLGCCAWPVCWAID